jgi:hypothetical protein
MLAFAGRDDHAILLSNRKVSKTLPEKVEGIEVAGVFNPAWSDSPRSDAFALPSQLWRQA